jgi:integrase
LPDVGVDELLGIVASVVTRGHLREAAKLRAYLRAAFAAGIRARQDARASRELRALGVTQNPARDLATIDGAASVRERALSVEELRAYWRRISALPDPAGALLRLHLLAGGQRIEQLARATRRELDSDASTLRLRDQKGRRKTPRLHVVPLLPPALEAVEALSPPSPDAFVFSLNGGESGAAYSAVALRVRQVAAAMSQAGELAGGPFTVGDLRRTVETRLAALGVPEHVRAQLQSHGLGGVQARHYDRHRYDDEKRAALARLYELVSGSVAAPIPLTARRAG